MTIKQMDPEQKQLFAFLVRKVGISGVALELQDLAAQKVLGDAASISGENAEHLRWDEWQEALKAAAASAHEMEQFESKALNPTQPDEGEDQSADAGDQQDA